jgi:hypothetical protein
VAHTGGEDGRTEEHPILDHDLGDVPERAVLLHPGTSTSPEIASQWHPTLNGTHTPQNVVWNSQRIVWWRAGCCGHEWPDTVLARDKYQRLRCPACRTFLGSLPGTTRVWLRSGAWRTRSPRGTYRIGAAGAPVLGELVVAQAGGQEVASIAFVEPAPHRKALLCGYVPAVASR